MKPQPTLDSTLRRLLPDEGGQMLPVIALMLVTLLAMAGFTLDLGRALFAHRALQASTDAAAMAGAALLPSSNAIATATQYSSLSGSLNAQPGLPNVTMVAGYPAIKCLATLSAQGEACTAPGNGNALVVKQQVTIPLFFLRLIGKRSLLLTASATAAMRGSVPSPYNVVIVVDATGSMNSADSGSNCSASRIACALAGVQILLANLSPCGATQASCGTVTNGNVPNAVDTVSLFTFPGLSSTADAQMDGDCSGNKPSISTYTYPALPTYQVVPFSSDYRTSDTSKSLASASPLVNAAGAGKNNCPGMQAIGGAGTYYAGVIYAAEAALVAQQSATPGTKNVLVLLSDGDAGTSSGKMSSTNNNGSYPSVVNQCQQAVTAAQAATAAGTHVYTVAYGANSSGCGTDTSGPQAGITPCQTMEQIASVPQNFYSDYSPQNGSSPCVSAAQSSSNLNQIFSNIAKSLTVGRLIPDNTP